MKYPWPPTKKSKSKIIEEYINSNDPDEPCPYGQLCWYPTTKKWGGWDSPDVRKRYGAYDREAKDIE